MDFHQLNFEFYNYQYDKLEFNINVNNIVDQITPLLTKESTDLNKYVSCCHTDTL